MTVSIEEVKVAANKAADAIQQEVSLSDEASDLLNLMVNATITMAENSEATLRDVIEENWDEDDWDSVLGWCSA